MLRHSFWESLEIPVLIGQEMDDVISGDTIGENNNYLSPLSGVLIIDILKIAQNFDVCDYERRFSLFCLYLDKFTLGYNRINI